jgi:hypothetical protein
MLFYLWMFIVSLIVATVILWFYRASKDTSKAIYTSIIPTKVDERPQGREFRPHFASHNSLNDAPSADSASIRSQKVGWPYREDMKRTGGKVYKATRKVPPPRKTNLKTLSKPWGW